MATKNRVWQVNKLKRNENNSLKISCGDVRARYHLIEGCCCCDVCKILKHFKFEGDKQSNNFRISKLFILKKILLI